MSINLYIGWRVLGLVIAIFLLSASLHFPLQKADASTYLFWNSQLDTRKTFGGLESIVIDEGRLEYTNSCGGPEHGNKGINDWIFTQSDIYIVEHRAFWQPSTADTHTALTDASNSPTFVVSFPAIPIFSDTLIGSSHRIGNGVFDVIYDECQDGLFNNEDRIFASAITVEIPQKFDMSRSAKSFVEQNKRDHAIIAKDIDAWNAGIETFYKIGKLAVGLAIFGPAYIPLFIIDVYIDKINDTLGDLNLPVYIPTGGVDFGFDVLETLLDKLAKRYRSLTADPPDLNYREPAELGNRTNEFGLNFESPLVKALSNMGKEMTNELSISDALLTSFERFQGAQIDGNAQWGLVHSYSLMDYSALLAKQIPNTQNAISDVIEVFSSDNSFDSQLKEFKEIQKRVSISGFNSSEIIEFKNMNLTNEEIDNIRSIFTSVDFSPNKQHIIDTLTSINSKYDELKSGLGSFSIAVQDTISQIKNDPLSRFLVDVPIARPGQNYSGVEGVPILFDGTLSSSPESNITTYEWDLDGDGKFNDSTLSTPQYTYLRSVHGLVGLKVTNDKGQTDVGYAEITVSDSNKSPIISNAMPNLHILEIGINDSQEFTISALDPDGGSPAIIWSIDDLMSWYRFVFYLLTRGE